MKTQRLLDTKGKASEYHVNSTLHHILGAKRFTPAKSLNEIQSYYLFDGILLPVSSWAKNHTQDMTEVDHLLVCPKGIFSIETKSISGKVFGEKSSNDWYSAQAIYNANRGIYDRVFRNPFKQNAFHVKAISEILKESGFKYWINNYVVLVDADVTGWESGHWAGKDIPELFMNAELLSEHIKGLPVALNKNEIEQVSKILYPYYIKKEENFNAFKQNFA